MRIDDDGISQPGRLFRRHTLAWAEVAAIDMDDRHAVITATNGATHRIPLRDVTQPAAIRDAFGHARLVHQRRLAAAPAAGS